MITISAFAALPQIPALARQAGIGLEFCGLVNPSFYDEAFIKATLASGHADLYQSAHGPFFDLIPASRDVEVRELAATKFKRAIAACRQLGIRRLVLHSGWISGFYPDADWIRNSIDFWQKLLPFCGDELSIFLENVMENRPALIKEIVDGVADPRFGVCLDVGHVPAFGKGIISDWIQELGGMIGHVHLHNNFGQEDEHNGLDKGSIDIAAVLAELRQVCPEATINMEVRCNLEASIKMIRELWP